MFRHFRAVCILVCLISPLACNTAVPTSPLPPTLNASATAAWQQTATAEAVRVQQAQAAAGTQTQAAQSAMAAAATQAAGLTATADASATAARSTSQARLAQRTATAQAKIVAATDAANPMALQVQRLVDEGYLASADGEFQPLPDFRESWAQLNWYQYWDAGVAASDFVLQADMHWVSASQTADWWNSGCGFVFREDKSADDHYLVYLGLDGYVNLDFWHKGKLTVISEQYYGKVDVPAGQAHILLVADGERLKVFLNDELVVKVIDNRLQRGRLAYTLVSGTNKDFGTRCELANVGLWKLK